MTGQDRVRLRADFAALPGSERRVAELVGVLTRDVRGEPGCVQFDPYTSADDPAHWHVVECYRDEAAFDAHLGSPHSQLFNTEIAEHIVGGASTLVFLVEPDFAQIERSG